MKFILILLLVQGNMVFASTPDSILQTIQAYHQGFTQVDSSMIRSVVAEQYTMINGNFSGDPKDWQAHLFMEKEQVGEWIHFMLDQAGPFENKLEVLHVHDRANAAVVVTSETGRNKFRSWKNQEVTYFLGRVGEDWKITALFIRDVKNPD